MVDGSARVCGVLIGCGRVHEWYVRGLVQRCVFVCINIGGDAKRLPFYVTLSYM